MKFFSQSFVYDDPWHIVTLAYFLRYPNPMASHVLSCDVLSRTLSPTSGNLHTTRLILKRSNAGNNLPRWLPKGIIGRTESWIVEESEVDVFGRQVSCVTRNVEHTKVMRVEEFVRLRDGHNGQTLQNTEARIVSRFGWGLAKRIEGYGLAKFKANVQRSREGVAIVVALVRQSRAGLGFQPITLGGQPSAPLPAFSSDEEESGGDDGQNTWAKIKSWLRRPPPDSSTHIDS